MFLFRKQLNLPSLVENKLKMISPFIVIAKKNAETVAEGSSCSVTCPSNMVAMCASTKKSATFECSDGRWTNNIEVYAIILSFLSRI